MAKKKLTRRRAHDGTPPVKAARLLEARERKGWRQMDLASEANVPASHISILEGDNGMDLRASTLVRLSRALEVSSDWLLGLSDKRTRD